MSHTINNLDAASAAAEQWRKERPDIDPFPMELLGRLGEITLLIMRDRLTPFFMEHGLQSGEFDVLATLRRSGAPYEITPTRLYESAMLSSGGMTARIDRTRAGRSGGAATPSDRSTWHTGGTDTERRLFGRYHACKACRKRASRIGGIDGGRAAAVQCAVNQVACRLEVENIVAALSGHHARTWAPASTLGNANAARSANT